jgi:hypothetical protein
MQEVYLCRTVCVSLCRRINTSRRLISESAQYNIVKCKPIYKNSYLQYGLYLKILISSAIYVSTLLSPVQFLSQNFVSPMQAFVKIFVEFLLTVEEKASFLKHTEF